MPRIKLCRLEELEPIDSRGFELDESDHDHGIFIVRNGNTVVAYQNSCPHDLTPLNWSPDVFLSYDKEYIQCANHGALFEIHDGRCIYGPCNGQALERLSIEIEDNIIFVVV